MASEDDKKPQDKKSEVKAPTPRPYKNTAAFSNDGRSFDGMDRAGETFEGTRTRDEDE